MNVYLVEMGRPEKKIAHIFVVAFGAAVALVLEKYDLQQPLMSLMPVDEGGLVCILDKEHNDNLNDSFTDEWYTWHGV